jgi:hypothetical protein
MSALRSLPTEEHATDQELEAMSVHQLKVTV